MNSRQYKYYRKILALMLVLVTVVLGQLQGCGFQSDTKLVLTTGFRADEVFRIEKSSCSRAEIAVYLTNTQNQYEQVYGEEIWEVNRDGVTLEENIKNTVLARVAKIKAMNLLAVEYEITLSEQEQTKAENAAAVYYESLTETEREVMQITQELLTQMYAEYALAWKIYDYIIQDVTPEVSDDEARTITVEHILIKTYDMDAQGNRTQLSVQDKVLAYQSALDLKARIEAGEDFSVLASAYNQASSTVLSFGKGEMETAFEEAAFNLGTGEISGIIETQEGYEIIKCLSAFSREETDANKIVILEQRRREAFDETYEAFVAGLTRTLNEKLWGEIRLVHDDEVTTTDFFHVYEDYFGTQNEGRSSGEN